MVERGRAHQLPYWPGLDGLRGVAVLGVLCFHGGFSWASGGFLGVSTFFTLSGFLITTLLVREHGEAGRIDLVAFWARRFRRLMPASLLALAGVVVFGATVASSGQLLNLRGDIVAALAYVANWRFVATGSDYADLFIEPSPVQHFWSLAIEEQFYVLFPLIVAGLLAVGRRRALTAGLTTLLIGSLLSVVLLHATGAEESRIYYGTDVRAGELLVGALLALAVLRWPALTHSRAVGVPALSALVASVVAFSVVDLQTPWLYRGGLVLFAVVSAVLVLGAVAPHGPVVTALGIAPLRELGRVSYGIYLFHWPIFLWLDPERTGLGEPALFILRAAVTIGVALLSFRLLEMPVRRGRLVGARRWVLAPAAIVAVLAGTLAVTADPPDDVFDLAAAEARVAALADPDSEAITCVDGRPQPAGPDAPRLTVLGDSTALALAPGLAAWARCSGDAVMNPPIIGAGCGLVAVGEVDGPRGQVPVSPGCVAWQEAWPEAITNQATDQFVVAFGPWETIDHRLPGADEWTAPGDPAYDDELSAAIHRLTRLLASTGAEVVWLTSPRVRLGQIDGRPPLRELPGNDPDRMDRFNELVRAVAADESVTVVEYGAHIDAFPDGGLGPEVRPDGVHLTEETARDVAVDWLGPALLAALPVASPG